MGKLYTRFQTETAQKNIPFGAAAYQYGLKKGVFSFPPAPAVFDGKR